MGSSGIHGGGGHGGAVPGAEDRGARADAAAGGGRHQVRGARAQGGVLPVLGHESIGPHRARRPHLRLLAPRCIPCCMKSCHESYQVTVFGPPAYQPPVCPFVAPPAQGIPTTARARKGGRYPRFEGSTAAAAGAVRWSLTNSVPRRVVHNSSNLRACHFPK